MENETEIMGMDRNHHCDNRCEQHCRPNHECEHKCDCHCCPGPRGPEGPRGCPGPMGRPGCPGPRGPMGPSKLLKGMQRHWVPIEPITLENNAPIPFNVTITEDTNYVDFTAPSTFTITQNGNYFISWELNTNGSTEEPVPTLSLVFSDGQIIPTTTTVNIGKLTATALVHITTAPVTFQLVNTTGNAILIPNLVESANIVIMHLESLLFDDAD